VKFQFNSVFSWLRAGLIYPRSSIYPLFFHHAATGTMTAREELVLPPIDPSISDENDWWEFGLSEVKVLRPGKLLYANLLEANENNPVQVIGQLDLKPNQEHLGT
jgi:hypothetical protein